MISLFKPNFSEKKLHRSFRAIISDPTQSPVQNVLQSWGEGLLDRKSESTKFVNEFQTTFNSAVWELYLNRAFMELNFDVDFSNSAPDFCITTAQGAKFNVEAVISDRSAVSLTVKNMTEEEYKIHGALKVIGKINDKLRIYRGQGNKKNPYSSLQHVRGNPFVLAIAPFDSDISLSQNNELINLVLFGLDSPSKDPANWGHQARIRAVQNRNGAKIDVGIFTNESFKEISAVIFSTTGTYGKAIVESGIDQWVRSCRYRVVDKKDPSANEPTWNLGVNFASRSYPNYLKSQRWDWGTHISGLDVRICKSEFWQETHLDGMHIYYNPFAEYPLDPGIFHSPEITHNFFEPAEDEPRQEHPDKALVSRILMAPELPMVTQMLILDGFID